MMAWVERIEDLLNRHAKIVGVIIVVCGLLWRFFRGADFYLSPDEAAHYTEAARDWGHGWAEFYRNSTLVVHPPLFMAVLHGILHFGSSQWLLRLVPTVSGALFPWFIMIWVQRFAGNAAALCAQLLLTFSPDLIDLSTEVRAYTLAFLFLSICLVLLEESVDHGSTPCMIWFHVFLYLAILTEYCVAWFAAALGVYALLRLWRNPAAGSLRATWALGQVGAVGLYLFLYFTHISRHPYAGLEDMYSTWLSAAFPQPHEHLLVFALKGSYRQFIYLFQLRSLARVGAIAFLFGLYKVLRSDSPSHGILLMLPLCFNCAGAILHLFPYGESRHSAILGMAIAAGVSIAVGSVTRNRILPIIMVALPLIFVWNALSVDLFLNIPRYRHHLSAMQDSIKFLRSSVPVGSVIVTDGGTDLMLGYYLDCPDYEYWEPEPLRMRQCAGLHFVVAPTFQFRGVADLRDTLSQEQAKYHSERPVWVAAGGYGIYVTNLASESRPFGKTIAIFKDVDLPAEPGRSP